MKIAVSCPRWWQKEVTDGDRRRLWPRANSGGQKVRRNFAEKATDPGVVSVSEVVKDGKCPWKMEVFRETSSRIIHLWMKGLWFVNYHWFSFSGDSNHVMTTFTAQLNPTCISLIGSMIFAGSNLHSGSVSDCYPLGPMIPWYPKMAHELRKFPFLTHSFLEASSPIVRLKVGESVVLPVVSQVKGANDKSYKPHSGDSFTVGTSIVRWLYKTIWHTFGAI